MRTTRAAVLWGVGEPWSVRLLASMYLAGKLNLDDMVTRERCWREKSFAV